MRDIRLAQDPRSQGVLLFFGSISSLMAAAMEGCLAVYGHYVGGVWVVMLALLHV